jgi:hypothetical protein
MPLGFNGHNNYTFYDTSEIKSLKKPFSENRLLESNIIYETEILLGK